MFTGSIVAIITPMTDNGNIDKASLKHLINYHVKSGTSGIVAVGTTGESATLDHQEHIDVIKYVLEYADGRIPVIAGTGANSTTEAINLTKQVEHLGIQGCLTVTPYYNKPTQEGLYQHFKVIAENTELPQILYNVPGRTGCDMKPDTVARLAKINNIVGLKDATGDLSRVHITRKLVGNDFSLLSGDDMTYLAFLQLGGNGVISVTANVAAAQMAKIYQLAAAGNFEQANALNDELESLHNNLFIESNPIPVKWASLRLGLISEGKLRLPMTELTENSQSVVEKALKRAKLI